MDCPDIQIVWLDDDIVAVHKPAGLLVHRNAHAGREPFLLQILRDRLGRRVYPVHRLDRPTTGLMILALSPGAASVLARQFAAHETIKTYLAVVRGFTPPCGVIDAPLKADSGNEQLAWTEFTRLDTAEIDLPVGRYATARFSLVRVRPMTGRTHQIRRHFAHIRHPLIGDVLRGDGRQNRFFREHFGLQRLLLASVELEFRHPGDGRRIRLACPPAKELLELFGSLGWADSFGVCPGSNEAESLKELTSAKQDIVDKNYQQFSQE
jgi:tRNA pseudouridine65 synthase